MADIGIYWYPYFTIKSYSCNWRWPLCLIYSGIYYNYTKVTHLWSKVGSSWWGQNRCALDSTALLIMHRTRYKLHTLPLISNDCSKQRVTWEHPRDHYFWPFMTLLFSYSWYIQISYEWSSSLHFHGKYIWRTLHLSMMEKWNMVHGGPKGC